ncbi:hypothetical protein NFHSH190041_06330 [Shewanella sp. NFH-SH190041]|nr:hypothetical protein [Shewanella sp. NFH-SH190041]BDM63181.1 hypothetical protein NFHSH190041_06330 [Shewanella sp. NFH-SH190041]
MLAFLRANLGLIVFVILFLAVILGGIWWVEATLAGQEQVIN